MSRFTGHCRHIAAPIVAIAALLCAVPRPAFYAHHHAVDGAGHVHTSAHGHRQVHQHRHDHGHDHGPDQDHAGSGAHSHHSVHDEVRAAGSATATRDHWHFQAPFQHAAMSLPGTDAHFERVTLIAAAPALMPPAHASPTPRSRGPPLLPPTH